jgi:hypothetical protein
MEKTCKTTPTSRRQIEKVDKEEFGGFWQKLQWKEM